MVENTAGTAAVDAKEVVEEVGVAEAVVPSSELAYWCIPVPVGTDTDTLLAVAL